MFNKSFFTFFVFIKMVLILSCKKEPATLDTPSITPNQIVLISIDAPAEYVHLMAQDSIGKSVKDSTGPKAIHPNRGFFYLDHMDNEKLWIPKPNINDTLIVETYSEFLELATQNFFTSIKETFLVKKGDTVLFTYNHLNPEAKIVNRKVNDWELNYNKHRLAELFDNKYTSHSLILLGNMLAQDDGIEGFDERSVHYYQLAKIDFDREMAYLDSLHQSNILSDEHFKYRKDALDMLMETHKTMKPIADWLKVNQSLLGDDQIEQPVSFDLNKTDSLMTFSFFRDYLDQITKYDLNLIMENRVGSGGSYIDSRIRFDSILADNRLNQTAKNHLLFKTYEGIGQNFKVKDKENYFEKLQQNTTNIEKLDAFQKKYNLDFSKSNTLILTNIANDTTTYSDVLQKNLGKWLYIDFWASWCRPCRENMPASVALKKSLANKNIEFIYISSYDKKNNWKKAMEADGIGKSQNYFIENGNVSKVIEDLGIETIPHYLIYNPEGLLINGYAERPGKSAEELLLRLMEL